MKLFRKPGSPYYYYDFRVRGRRYRGSTKETSYKRAEGVADAKRDKARGGKKPNSEKVPTLREAGKRFEGWVESAHLDPDTGRYYKNGLRLLRAHEEFLDMQLDEIESDDIDALEFPGSGSNANNALRTLRRIFNKARKDWKVIHETPAINLLEERERTMLLDQDAEEQLLAVAEQPLADIIKLMRDLGVRNGKELYPLRIEHIHWRKHLVQIPDSKTKAGQRLVPMSHRAEAILRDRCGDRKEGWVFPSCRKGAHITSGLVNKQWVRARKKAGLSKDLVLYCGRHDYGTEMTERTGNLKAVMEVMGHVDVKTAMKYQHPGLRVVGDAIRARS
ncbi:MAG: tyrosine-type recombinase/integrase [Terracidiphilus sp.]